VRYSLFRMMALPRGLTLGPLHKLLLVRNAGTGNLYASFGCERRQHCNPKNEARLDFPLPDRSVLETYHSGLT
jgi:hypothetical protein